MPAAEKQRLAYRDTFSHRFGNDFQRWFETLAAALHPAGDFQCIRITSGDGGLDGLAVNSQRVYQVFAPARINEMRDSDTAAKIRKDFPKVLKHLSGQIKSWVFLHNHPEAKIGKETAAAISELKAANPTVEILVLDIDSLWDLLKVLPDTALAKLFGPPTVSPIPDPLHQLPSIPSDFVGRTAELDTLLGHIGPGATIAGKAGAAGVGGLVGMGGVGKTALALVAAHRLAGRYPDAQFFVELRGTDKKPLSSAEALSAILQSIHRGQKLPDDLPTLRQFYLQALHGKRALILADNAADAAQVTPLLPPAGCVLLVTSRQHFVVPGLTPINLDCLPEPDAIQLLTTICPRIANHAAALARACGRLPLALRLAASALAARDTLAVADHLARLTDTTQRLTALDQYRDQSAEQIGVAASLQSSYDLLAAHLQSRWRMLSVFPASFDAPAAGAIWSLPPDAAAETLGDLRKYSLVEWDAKTRRFSLHDLARDFAQAALTPAERDPATQRHAEHFFALLATAGELYEKGHDNILAGLSLFDSERPNIEAGQSWAAAHADSSDAARLANAYPNLGRYLLSLRLHPRQWIDWLSAALAAARRLKHRATEGWHLGNIGIAYADLGEARKAIEFYEQALVIAREIGDRRGEGAVLCNLGSAHLDLGDARKAIEFYEQNLVTAREIGDRRGEGAVLGNLGSAHLNLRDAREAIEFYEQDLVIAREIGDRRGEGAALWGLGAAHADLGEASKAIEFYEQALPMFHEIGYRQGEALASWNLGNELIKQGERERGLALMQVRVDYLRELGHPDAAKHATRVEELRRQS